MATKRIVVWVEWRNGAWTIWRRPKRKWSRGWTRAETVAIAAATCRKLHREGHLLQLKVRNKRDGRISFERTYGADPKRSKG